MQLFKLVVSMAMFGFLFNDQINAKHPEAIIAIAIILAGYLIGNGGTIIVRFSDFGRVAELVKKEDRRVAVESKSCLKEEK